MSVVEQAADLFVEFPKIARTFRECVITEKIDGTNACVRITEDGRILAGSRTRWITPQDDNYGFAKWVESNKDELMQLGVGTHFGEWWGSGCQRGYGLPKGEKRWSLFNTVRWCEHGKEPKQIPSGDHRVVNFQQVLPERCHLVPELYRGMFDTDSVDQCVDLLRLKGSMAAPGFMKPEGIVCFHIAANIAFKTTLEKDHEHKTVK